MGQREEGEGTKYKHIQLQLAWLGMYFSFIPNICWGDCLYTHLRWYGTPDNINVVKIRFNQTTFTGLEFLNFTIFDQKILKKMFLDK